MASADVHGVRTRSSVKPSVQGLEIILWALLAFLAAGSTLVLRPSPLADDSYQYLSAAENLSHGRGFSTSLVHFDIERSNGRIPAPLTTFPPGYPLVVALVPLQGHLEAAARGVSLVSYAGAAALLSWTLILAGVTTFFRQVMMLLFTTNAVALVFATSVLSEPLYVLLSVGAIAGLVWVEKRTLPDRTVIALTVISCSLAGVAFWVRYAGLFQIAAIVIYFLVQFTLRRDRLSAVSLWIAVIPVMAAGTLMLRNLVTVGTWKGGNDMLVFHSLNSVLAGYFRSQLHLVWGVRAVAFGFWEVLLVVGALGVAAVVAVVAADGVRHARWPRAGAWRKPDSATLLAVLCVVVYSAGMFYAGLRTVISFGARMFLPLLPVYLLLLGIGLTRVTHGAGSVFLKLCLVVATLGYVGANVRHLCGPLKPARHDVLAGLYNKPGGDGRPLLQWVESNIPSGEAIVAADGQATGFLLRRPTVSMAGPEFSSVRWECAEVKKEMRRFKARYVILYKSESDVGNQLLLTESKFVAASATGRPACGFVIAAENSDVRILTAGGGQ